MFSQMIFFLGIVHNDLHPGNILVASTGKVSLLRRIGAILLGSSWVARKNFKIVLLDHGLCCKVSEEFQYNYAKLWRSIIRFDEDGIKKYSEFFFDKTPSCGPSKILAHRMFASMITGRPWHTISGFEVHEFTSDQKPHVSAEGIVGKRTEREKEIIRLRMRERAYLDAMADVLSAISRELMLILKTGDLIRSLDESIGARGQGGSFADVVALTAAHCSDIIYSREKSRLLSRVRSDGSPLSRCFPATLLVLFSREYWGYLGEWWHIRLLSLAIGMSHNTY